MYMMYQYVAPLWRTQIKIPLKSLISLGPRATVSPKNAQISKQQVKYLGYIINPGSRRHLSPDKKQAILGLSILKTKKHLCTFLGMAGFCRIWNPGFELMAKSLYEATKGPDAEQSLWTGGQEKAFNTIKQALTRAPALGLPN